MAATLAGRKIKTVMPMRSQTKWGIAFVIIGLLIAPLLFPFTLLYSIPLLGIGLALILFRRREEIIEKP